MVNTMGGQTFVTVQPPPSTPKPTNLAWTDARKGNLSARSDARHLDQLGHPKRKREVVFQPSIFRCENVSFIVSGRGSLGFWCFQNLGKKIQSEFSNGLLMLVILVKQLEFCKDPKFETRRHYPHPFSGPRLGTTQPTYAKGEK